MFEKCMDALFWPSIFVVVLSAGIIWFFDGVIAGVAFLMVGSLSVSAVWFALHWLSIPAAKIDRAKVVETDSGMLVKVDEEGGSK